jgi:predicted PurR-regulated permease PerM
MNGAPAAPRHDDADDMKGGRRMLQKLKGAEVHRLPARSGDSRWTAARGLLLLAIGALLYVAHTAFVPVALALLIALILSGPVEALHTKRVPRGLSAVLCMLLLLGLLAGTANLVSEPAQQWFSNAPQTLRAVKQKIRPLARVVDRIKEIRNNASNIGSSSKTPPAAAPIVTPAPDAPAMLDATRAAAVSTVTVVILSIFFLAGGPPMFARLATAFAGDVQSARVIDLIEKLRREVGRFYLTTALINLGLGTATTILMTALGMPAPLLWGTTAAILNFIPYAGSATTLLLLTSVAIVSFDSLGHVLAVAGGYLALATLEGQVVQPLLVGRRLELNPVIVFLALWFGGFFWGIAGIILATPTLVALKVYAENSRDGKPLLDFLSPRRGRRMLPRVDRQT